MAVSAPPASFTNRQVSKLQQRGLGLAIDGAGIISRQGAPVGHCDPESPLFPDLKALLDNLDTLGLDYRQGVDKADPENLKQIASFPEEVVLTPAPEGAAVGVKLDGQFERAAFTDLDAARDVARLYEDYPQLARDLASRRGLELELEGERPQLSSVADSPEHEPQSTPSHDSGYDFGE